MGEFGGRMRPPAQLVAAFAARQGKRGDSSDGVEGLAAEAKGIDAGEIFRGQDLAHRVCRICES